MEYMPNIKVTIYIDKELIKSLKKKAIDEETNVSQLLSQLIKQYLKK